MAARILIVAHRTAATPLLIEHIRRRAARESCSFTLLVPRPYWDPDTDEASITLELALPLLEDAAGSTVNGVIGVSDAYIAARDELERGEYTEVIISTLPERISHWLRRDLPHRVEQLGVPVTVVTAAGVRSAVTDPGA